MKHTLLLLVLVCCGLPAAAQPVGDWPMFRGNAAHEGRSPYEGPRLPSVRWERSLLAGTYSSPAVGSDGTVYVGSSDALFAVSPDGELQWSSDLGDFSISSPALGSGTVFAGSTSGQIFAVSMTDGGRRWVFETGGEVWSSPLLGPDGTLFIGSADGMVYALDSNTGRERWRFAAPDEVFATPVLDANGILYVTAGNGFGAALRARDGSVVHSYRIPADAVSSPAIATPGLLVQAGEDGTLYGIDRSRGTIQWTADLGGEIVSSPAIGPEGTIYAASSNGSVQAVDPSTGDALWSVELDGEVYASPLLDDAGILYLGGVNSDDDSGTLHAMRAEDGEVLWTRSFASPIWSSAALAEDGTLYVAEAGRDEVAGVLVALESALFLADSADEPVAGQALPVDITEPQAFSPVSGMLFYRRGGEREYASTAVDLASTEDVLTATIPPEFVTERGVEFYVSLSDGRTEHTYPGSRAAQRPVVRRVLVRSMTTPAALEPRQYAMVSVPLELENPEPAEVLADDYGAYEPSSWRLLRWNGAQYDEYPGLAETFAPGSAFFLAHRSGAPFTVEQGRSVDTSQPQRVTLQPGWNQVGVPFAFPVDWEDVVVTDPEAGGAIREIAFFDGSQMLQSPDEFAPLQPWLGYFIRNGLDRPVQIAFPNEESAVPDEPATGLAKTYGTSGERSGFVLRLNAHALSTSRLDTQNWLGFLPGSRNGEDQLDLHEAPPFGEHLRLSIIENDQRFAASYRPAEGPGQQWQLEIELVPTPEASEWVQVELAPDGSLPDDFEIHVLDEDRKETVAVIDDAFRVRVDAHHPVRRLSVVIGSPAFLEEPLREMREHPTAYFLDPAYPNPFHSTTSVRFGNEAPSHVSIEVFNAMGQHVVTLIDEIRDAGQHEITWDGRDSAGREVASGLYIYRMHTGTFSEARGLMLVR